MVDSGLFRLPDTSELASILARRFINSLCCRVNVPLALMREVCLVVHHVMFMHAEVTFALSHPSAIISIYRPADGPSGLIYC